MNSPNSIPRVLMELRTCFEKFAGIPQETRLLFSAFLDMPDLKVDGLINHTGRRLGRGLIPGKKYDQTNVHERHDRLSKFIVSTMETRSPNYVIRTLAEWRRDIAKFEIAALTKFGQSLRMFEFDAADYEDFAWETFFAATLPPDEIGKISSARYRTLAPSWRSMHRAGLVGGALSAYPVLDTSGYDVVMTQTPYPARLPKGSRLLVRYHDAIPIYLPHTIPTAPFHRKSHYRALRDNASHAVFGCTSEAARSDLLKMFPSLEKRTPVIHDVVSHGYFPERVSPVEAAEIVRSRINAHSEPRWKSAVEKTAFYDQNLLAKPLQYIMMVSSVEPRKNHIRLLRAWERLRANGHSNLKLMIVGSLGWEFDPIIEAFRPWQERGMLFHLSGVPTTDLRQLYSSASCVVCPSLAEGFDLSGVEAMLCGTLVAASDIPVHREVYGQAARYFDRYSVPDFAECISDLIDVKKEAEQEILRTLGLDHSQQYKREVIAPKWGELFEQIRAGHFS